VSKEKMAYRLMIALKRNPKSTKCSYQLTTIFIAQVAKIVARMLRTPIEKKVQDVFGED
jgi:hypothetical protein